MGGATTDFATTQLEHARNVGKETSDLGSDSGPDPGPDPSLLGLAQPEGTKLPWTELPLGKAVDTLGRWQPLSFYSFDNSYSSSAPPASCQAKSALGLSHWLANTRNAREPWAPPSSAASGQTGRNVPSQLHTGEPGRPTDAEGHCSFTMLTAVSTFPAASLPRDRSLSPLTWARWLWDQRIVPCAPTTAIMSRSENRLLSVHYSFLEGPFSRAFISTVCC